MSVISGIGKVCLLLCVVLVLANCDAPTISPKEGACSDQTAFVETHAKSAAGLRVCLVLGGASRVVWLRKSGELCDNDSSATECGIVRLGTDDQQYNSFSLYAFADQGLLDVSALEGQCQSFATGSTCDRDAKGMCLARWTFGLVDGVVSSCQFEGLVARQEVFVDTGEWVTVTDTEKRPSERRPERLPDELMSRPDEPVSRPDEPFVKEEPLVREEPVVEEPITKEEPFVPEPRPEPKPEPKPEPSLPDKMVPETPQDKKVSLPDSVVAIDAIKVDLVPITCQKPGGGVAAPGETQLCYSGTLLSLGKGACQEGSQTCQSDGKWTACTGDVLPKQEVCGNSKDDDCDGLVDEHCQVNCPAGVSKPCVVTLNSPVDWRTDFGACYILDRPGGMVRDGDFLYLSDTNRHRIMRYDTKTKEMAVLAGTGTTGSTNGSATAASFSSPRGLAVVNRVLYVADTGNHVIRSIDLDTFQVATFAGKNGISGKDNGFSSAARFNAPRDLIADTTNGILYVSDTGNHTIRKIVLAGGGSVSLVAGSPGVLGGKDGAASTSSFHAPRGLALDAARNLLYVADRDNHKLRVIDLVQKSVAKIAGSAPSYINGALNVATFNAPTGLWFDKGSLYVADAGNQVIRKVDLTAKFVSTVVGTPGKSGYRNGVTGVNARFYEPLLISPGRNANELFVLDSLNGAVRTVDLSPGTNQVARLVGPAVPPYINVPLRCVRISSPRANGTYPAPGSLLLEGDKLYYTENGEGHTFVHEIDLPTRKVKTLAGSGDQGTTNGQGSAVSFDRPTGLAKAGTAIYLTEPVKHMIRTIDTTGTVDRLAGTSGSFGSQNGSFSIALFRAPVSIVSDGVDVLFVSDMFNVSIRALDLKTQMVSSLPLRGPDVPTKPQAMVIDRANGLLYLVDKESFVKKVEFSKPTGSNVSTIYTLPASLGVIHRLALDTTGTSLYITTSKGSTDARVQKLDLTTNPVTVTTLTNTKYVNTPVDGAASGVGWGRPVGIAVDSNDNIYVYDEIQRRIRVILTK